MMGHPAEHRLIGFLDGSLTDTRRRAVAAHLADCQRCRDIVQAHRLTRHALGGETAAAPIDVLGRVLATRASGGGVILPVDVEREPRRPPFAIRHLKLGAAAAVLVAVVVALTRVPLPSLGLQRGLGGLGSTLQEVWSHALEVESFNGPPRLMQRPDAPPPALDPTRLHEFTARYETRHFTDGQLSSVDSATELRVRRAGDMWQVTALEGPSPWNRTVTVAMMDARTLRLNSMTRAVIWTRTSRGVESREVSVREVRQLGDTAVLSRRTYSTTRTLHPNSVKSREDTLEAFQIVPRNGAPLTYGDWGIRVTLMTATSLDQGWLGALDDLDYFQNYRGRGYLAQRETESRRVRGRKSLTLPIGKVKTWRVERWESYGVYPTSEYYRQSDGLLVAETSDSRDYDFPERRLLSVSYP